MLISEEWLREWVNPKQDLRQIAYDLTQAGLEVESISESGGEVLQQIVVAEITAAARHPNADRLQLCRVSDGRDTYEIVCGAPNARAGMKVALARVGTVLPGNFKIKRSKIRGAASEGMLCSERELQLSDEHQGIIELPADAKLGEPLAKYIPPRPAVMDLAITPNRGDCLSHWGVARDLAALYDLPLAKPPTGKVKPQHKEELPIELADPQGCPRYLGRIIKGIDINKPTPDWMKQRLTAVGLNPISIAVDVTNYVMYELGQPLHAFDLRQLERGLVVRRAAPGEELTMLDGRALKLDADDLLIADHKKALALAGVMGGKHSGIAEDTVDVFLEVAYFSSERVFGKQQKYGLATDAAYRYERHVDPELCFAAMERATALLVEHAGGAPGPVTEGVSREHLPPPRSIALSHASAGAFLGFDHDSGYYIDEQECERILTQLGMELTEVKQGGAARAGKNGVGGGARDDKTNRKTAGLNSGAGDEHQGAGAAGKVWRVAIPGHRADIDCPEALYEELARIYGYDKIPSTIPAGFASPQAANTEIHQEDRMRDILATRGFNEAVNYAFIGLKECESFYPGMTHLPLTNPISAERAVMRPGLLPGLLSSLAHNQRQNKDVHLLKLFEIGHCFPAMGARQVVERNYLGLAVMLPHRTRIGGAATAAAHYDFALLHAEIEALLKLLHLDSRAEFVYDYKEDARTNLFHPKQQFALRVHGARIPAAGSPGTGDATVEAGGRDSASGKDGGAGIIGAGGLLNPYHLAEYKLKDYSVYFFSCDLDALPTSNRPVYKKLATAPASYLELSLQVAAAMPYAELEKLVRKSAGPKLVDVKLLDIYSGGDLQSKGLKSVSLLLRWQAGDVTLTDAEVNKLAAAMLQKLAKHHITLRSQ